MVSGSRLESIFSRVGLASTALFALFSLLLLDVTLTARFSAQDSAGSDAFSLHFVTRDGREIGGREVATDVTVALTPLTFYENAPNQQGRIYRTNAQGLRGGPIAQQPTRPRVIVVGGSAAFGLRVPERATFAARLGSRLPGVEVLNAGVSGYLSAQEVALVVTRLLDLAPDLLIVYDGWNDVYAPYWWSLFGDETPPHPGVNNGFRVLEDRLVRHLEIERDFLAALLEAGRTLVRRSSVLGALASRLRPEATAAPGSGLTDTQRAAIASGYVANLLKLQDLAKARGIGLLVVVQPEIGQRVTPERRAHFAGHDSTEFISGDDYLQHFPEIYGEFRRTVVPALQAAGVRVIDASLRFALLPETPKLFVDAVHLTEDGHDQIARLIMRPVFRLLESKRANHAGGASAGGIQAPE